MKRRRVYFEQVERLLPNGKSHPLLGITKNCLQDVPSQRPTAQELVTELERMMINTAIYFGPIVTRQDAVKQVVTLWKQEMMNSKAKELEILQQQMDQIMFKTQEEITQVMIENLQSKEKEIQSLHQDLATLRDIISLQEIDKELQSQQDNLSKVVHYAIADT